MNTENLKQINVVVALYNTWEERTYLIPDSVPVEKALDHIEEHSVDYYVEESGHDTEFVEVIYDGATEYNPNQIDPAKQ